MSSKPLIKDSLLFLRICGLNLYKSDAWTNLRAVAALTIFLFVSVNLLLDLIMHWEGLGSMQGISVCVGVYQVTSKYLMVMIYRRRLARVVTKFEAFWPVNKCSPELKKEIESSHMFVKQSVKFMAFMLVATISAFIIIPLWGKKLPFKAYYPTDMNKFLNYELTFLLQCLLMGIGSIAMFGIDGLFLALIINVTWELKMLREGFGRVSINPGFQRESEEDLLALYRMIDHHALIAECIKDIREIYSIFLLNVYFYSMACMALGLLSMVATGFPPSLDGILKYGLFGVFYAFHLFSYCATGTYLTTESEHISTVVYETDWWIKTQPELRRAYVLILMRGNKVETLTAGGMFTLNLESFTKIVRSTLSLFTLVEAIYKN